MTPTPRNRSKRIPRLVHALAGIALFFGGSDVAAIYGGHALQLRLSFAWTAYLTPFLAVAAYATVGGFLSRTRLGRAAWAFGYAVGAFVGSTPTFVEARYAQAIPLSRWLEPGERMTLNARFPHPYIEISSSGKGIRLLIRRSDYDPSLTEFLESIHALPKA